MLYPLQHLIYKGVSNRNGAGRGANTIQAIENFPISQGGIPHEKYHWRSENKKGENFFRGFLDKYTEYFNERK